ncbi:MAG: hypothetical protein DDT19_00947 [Syntrophomonadaceae bacterium]|nr:hypothetical protein [Bacillota bacterium]
MESREPQFGAEQPPKPESPEVAQAEKDLNEIIPVLAHGLVRRIEQKGFSGKVRVRAMAGRDWGVAKSPDNPTDIPNVVVYPREFLSGDKRLANARLRHEIGNLNYPIDAELNDLRDWCATQGIAPELLTSLVEATHEATVNYLEIRASHSDQPEENFRALYERDVNTQAIADNIAKSAPYKQAVDAVLLYSLSQTGLIPKEQFEQALNNADPMVREIFDKQTRSVLDQAVKIAVPQRQVQLVRDYLWSKFSKLAALSVGPARAEAEKKEEYHDEKAYEILEEIKTGQKPEAEARAEQAKAIQEKMQKLMKKMRQKPAEAKDGRKPPQEQRRGEHKELPRTQDQQLSPAEKKERAEEENMLVKNLQEQLQTAKDQLEQLQKPGAKPDAKKPQEKTSSMQEIGKQAEQMRQEAEKALQEAREEVTEEQLQKLKEQLEQLEEVAKQIAESGALEKELAKPEDEPMTYNIKEYGINEAELTPEQLKNLQKTRLFAQNTSKVYRTAMRLLMTGYQQKNPKFTDKMMQKMMERGYDLPDFSLYGSQSAAEFLSKQEELGIEGFGDNFLVNFQLPKPLAKFWYKGGEGTKSIPVKEGEIEWGHFYRMCMPVIYSGVDRAQMSGLFLNRLNQFGQHDPKKYYYLWETIVAELPEAQGEEGKEGEPEEEKGEEAGAEEIKGEKPGAEGAEAGEQGAPQEAQGEGAGEVEGGMPSVGEMQDLIGQMQEMLKQAQAQSSTPGGQEVIQQILDQLTQIQENLQSGASPQELAGQMAGAMEKMSEMVSEMQEIEGGEDLGMGGKPGEGAGAGEAGEQPHDQFQKGGKTHKRAVESLFSRIDPELLKQLRQTEMMVGSKFSTQDENGNFTSKDVSDDVSEFLKSQMNQTEQVHARQLETLEELKRQQAAKMEAMYREMSGLDGEALRVYIEHMESMKEFIGDLTNFFIEKFKLDREYLYERHQRRGARLQRGFTQNILGQKRSRMVISPRSFERKRPPKKPQFAWSLIIDNSGSCSGEIIEQEKKLAVALVEVAKTLDIPLEIVTFGGPDQFTFLKQFEQDISGDDLQKIVLLNADQGTPDVVTLDAACTSMEKFTDKFKRSYNFVYFMTDGQSGEGSIQEVIKKHKKDMVITGIGMAEAAQTITQTWGKNAVEVPDVKKLSDAFIRKVENQIDSTFD